MKLNLVILLLVLMLTFGSSALATQETYTADIRIENGVAYGGDGSILGYVNQDTAVGELGDDSVEISALVTMCAVFFCGGVFAKKKAKVG